MTALVQEHASKLSPCPSGSRRLLQQHLQHLKNGFEIMGACCDAQYHASSVKHPQNLGLGPQPAKCSENLTTAPANQPLISTICQRLRLQAGCAWPEQQKL